LFFITIPYTWFFLLKHYLSQGDDHNCIKKYHNFMSGDVRLSVPIGIDMKKAKEFAK
jgi:hypothetical protein